MATAGSSNCGGVALLVREDERKFLMENSKVVGPNVINCKIITGSGKNKGDETRWFVVCCYSPPSDTKGNTHRRLEHALDNAPKGTKPIVIGDLNANLARPRDGHDDVLSVGMREHGLHCTT